MDRELGGLIMLALAACSSQAQTDTPSQVRVERPTLVDDPATTNDESNDRPLRTSGTMTLCATNHGSGNSYPLDADVDNGSLLTIYFQKGGNVDFTDCDLDENMEGDCDDDEGRGWTFTGQC